MARRLHLVGDPNAWILDSGPEVTQFKADLSAGRPVTLEVSEPVTARLILNGHVVQAVVIGPQLPTNWLPSHMMVATTSVHLLGSPLPSGAFPLALPDAADPAQFEQQLLHAFAARRTIEADVLDHGTPSTLILNGRSTLGVVLVRRLRSAEPS